jgi:hypothetical protein
LTTDNKDFKVRNGLSVGGSGAFGGAVVVGSPTIDTHAATKQYVDQNAGGGLIVSDTAPETESSQEGDQWYNSTDGGTYIFYDGFWVEASTGAEVSTLNVNAPLTYDQDNAVLALDPDFLQDYEVMNIMGAY